MTSNIGRLGTSGRVSAPNICNGPVSFRTLSKNTFQPTCALVVHQSLTVRMPSSSPWPPPCNSLLVVSAPRPICAKTTWVKEGPARRLMNRPLNPPKFPTRERQTALEVLLDAALSVLPVNAKGIGERLGCRRKQSWVRH
jgi:hypothetical protein